MANSPPMMALAATTAHRKPSRSERLWSHLEGYQSLVWIYFGLQAFPAGWRERSLQFNPARGQDFKGCRQPLKSCPHGGSNFSAGEGESVPTHSYVVE